MAGLLGVAVVAAFAVAAESDDLNVEYVTATVEPLRLDIELSGTIEAVDSVDLGFRQSGRVIEVLVEEGDHVRPDQALARLDPEQQYQALKVAEAGWAAARATQAQAHQASDRAKAMLERGVGTQAQLDAATQASSEADGLVKQADSSVDQARRAVEDTVLRASDVSVVTARLIAPGQIVGAAQPALSLARLDGLEAVFQAPDHPLLRESMGRKVRLATIDIERPGMTGTVTEIAPLVDPQTGTVTLRARIDEFGGSDGLLGVAVRGHLMMSVGEGIALPWTALMRLGDGPAVWIVGKDDRAALVPVQISHFADRTVYLSEGIEAGQIVIGAGSQLLYPGRRVRPAEVLP
ncbi:efflux RND transporter periplasmic adaptor subunit [Paracoccus marinaquae]|uniref:Efflux RND transporter periplasmic adaptor subunit n=1 Tax=Paracoccus marinaquae TaxID=2841926 RepID=A0ABS6ADG9_9RHOB|nr:efflux RND transporter periplasmic adaptor subunit [Paracoccus marinaquae]MBU3028643.1 efflux RND transporter periplasmic adaptor subunit [Paracoccus marinaquae]